MGNRAQLAFGTCCEFEANNCVPVTWLALFESDEFLVERRVEELGQSTEDPIQKPEPGVFHKLLVAIRSAFRQERTETSAGDVQTQPFRELEEYDLAVYRTSKLQAVRSVELAIGRLKGQTPIWAFLRPLEILRDDFFYVPKKPLNLI